MMIFLVRDRFHLQVISPSFAFSPPLFPLFPAFLSSQAPHLFLHEKVGTPRGQAARSDTPLRSFFRSFLLHVFPLTSYGGIFCLQGEYLLVPEKGIFAFAKCHCGFFFRSLSSTRPLFLFFFLHVLVLFHGVLSLRHGMTRDDFLNGSPFSSIFHSLFKIPLVTLPLLVRRLLVSRRRPSSTPSAEQPKSDSPPLSELKQVFFFSVLKLLF